MCENEGLKHTYETRNILHHQRTASELSLLRAAVSGPFLLPSLPSILDL